ncbi:MAG: hypothetical protein ABIF82_03405 [Planctomycetota bacterium]
MQIAFSPYLADSDIPGLITVIAAFLYGLYWFFRKMAESKEEQRRTAERERTRGTEEEEEDDESYIADEQEVRRFLETLGVEAEPRPEPPRRPQPTQPPMPPPAQPGRPPQLRPQRPFQAEPEPLLLEPPPPRPMPAQQAQPAEPEEAYSFGSGPSEPAAAKLPRAAGRVVKRQVTKENREAACDAVSPAGRLEFPQLGPLQRAIILSDILVRRPGPHRHGRR